MHFIMLQSLLFPILHKVPKQHPCLPVITTSFPFAPSCKEGEWKQEISAWVLPGLYFVFMEDSKIIRPSLSFMQTPQFYLSNWVHHTSIKTFRPGYELLSQRTEHQLYHLETIHKAILKPPKHFSIQRRWKYFLYTLDLSLNFHRCICKCSI